MNHQQATSPCNFPEPYSLKVYNLPTRTLLSFYGFLSLRTWKQNYFMLMLHAHTFHIHVAVLVVAYSPWLRLQHHLNDPSKEEIWNKHYHWGKFNYNNFYINILLSCRRRDTAGVEVCTKNILISKASTHLDNSHLPRQGFTFSVAVNEVKNIN